MVEGTREIARDVVPGHLDLRAPAEKCVRGAGTDGIERHRPPSASKSLRLLDGDVTEQRLLYQACGVEGLASQDKALSLSNDCFSMGERRREVEEAIRGSFDEVEECLKSTTAAYVAKRQANPPVLAAAVDFEAFYSTQPCQKERKEQLLVLTFDGPGIVMRREGLREQTRKKVQQNALQPNARSERPKAGEKANRKRMADLASAYSIEPCIRSADDTICDIASIRLVRPIEPCRRPRPVNKRVCASDKREMVEVIDEGFREARRRDPEQQQRWVVLVDGQTQQRMAIVDAVKRHGVTVTITCDFIYVMKYLWKAAHCFHEPGSNEARLWGSERARTLLEGVDPSQVAVGMRRLVR